MRPAVGLLLFYKEKSEENENIKIAVAGTGYVGLSLSVLLAQHNQVMAVDIVQAKVDMIEIVVKELCTRTRHIPLACTLKLKTSTR